MDVNFLSVVVAGVVAFLLGALWYAPFLFGKQWQAQTGKEWSTAQNVGLSYGITFVGFVLLAWAMAVFMSQGGVIGVDGGIKTALLFYLFVVAPLMLSQTMFGDQKIRLFLIDASYRLVSTLLIGVIIGFWA